MNFLVDMNFLMVIIPKIYDPYLDLMTLTGPSAGMV